MKALNILPLLLITILISACGSTPQTAVPLKTNFFSEDIKIGIVYQGPKKEANTNIYGAACLLCYGVASSLTSKLDTHLKKAISTEELDGIKNLVFKKYSEKSNSVEFVTLPSTIDKLKKFKGELGFAKKDFRGLKEKLGVDLLVVLNILEHGAFRSFSNYIPNGDPQGYVAGLLYAVDLDDNSYIQYLDITSKVQPQGEWDEPTNFPSVTTSYYQAIENTKQKISSSM